MPGKHWSNEETEKFKQLARSGATYQEIQDALGRSHQSLYVKALRLGITVSPSIPKNAWTDGEIDTLRKMVENGADYAEIGNAIGRTSGAVSCKAREIGCLSNRARQIIENTELAQEGLKRCSECLEIRPIGDFYNAGWGYCRDCEREKAKRYDASSIKRRLTERFGSARSRATRKGIPFTISRSWLTKLWNNQGGKCFYTGRQMVLNGDGRYSVSIDRKDPSRGYTKENVVLCCTIVNKMKSDQSVEDLKDWCLAILSYET